MTPQEQRAYCLSVMKTSPVCHLATINEAGFPEIRALFNLKNVKTFPALVKLMDRYDSDFTVILGTNTSSVKVKQVAREPKVSVYFCNTDAFQGVMLTGSMEIVTDSALKRELWQPGWEMYYPRGADDPDFTVLRLTPDAVKAYGNLHTFTLTREAV
jgi:general stress protein 26